MQKDKSATLATNNDQMLFEPTYCLQGNGIDRADTARCNGKGWKEETSYTLNTIDRPAVNDINYVVRRLTPTECARLQGFPDDWCDGIPHTDAAEYKMWGNGMALPNALYIMEGAADYFRELGYDC